MASDRFLLAAGLLAFAWLGTRSQIPSTALEADLIFAPAPDSPRFGTKTYSVQVSDTLTPASATESADAVYQNRASGTIVDTADAYNVTGELVAVRVSPGVRVLWKNDDITDSTVVTVG